MAPNWSEGSTLPRCQGRPVCRPGADACGPPLRQPCRAGAPTRRSARTRPRRRGTSRRTARGCDRGSTASAFARRASAARRAADRPATAPRRGCCRACGFPAACCDTRSCSADADGRRRSRARFQLAMSPADLFPTRRPTTCVYTNTLSCAIELVGRPRERRLLPEPAHIVHVEPHVDEAAAVAARRPHPGDVRVRP